MSRRPFVTLEHEDPGAEVLVVTSGWPNEDDETYCVFVKRQMESLMRRGVRCDVLFIRGYRSSLAYIVAALRLAWWSVTRKRSYRLVHAHSGEAALAAAFYRRAPLLVSYLGDDLLGPPDAHGHVPLRNRLRRGLFRQHSRLARQTITKSTEMESALPTAVRRRNAVVPNGVDPSLFRPMDRAAARAELGWDSQDRIALFAANPEEGRKRYWLARDGVQAARSHLSDLHLKVAYGVNPDRMPLIMNASDCLLLTSSIEGSPNVAKEALMCDLPIVATPAGDIQELLEGVRPSAVCQPTISAVSAALVECLREPQRSNGRDRSQRLAEGVIAIRILDLYKRIAPELDLRLVPEPTG